MSTKTDKSLIYKLSDINDSLKSLISAIEKEYDLSNNMKYRVRTYGGKVFDVYYIRCDVYYGTWSKKLDIYLSFYKSKKDGEKSKVEDGFFLKEVQNITPCPF